MLAVHGGGRFVSLGESKSGATRWEFFERDELLTRILGRSAGARAEDPRLLALRSAIRNYFGLMNLSLALLVLAIVGGAYNWQRVPVAKVASIDQPKPLAAGIEVGESDGADATPAEAEVEEAETAEADEEGPRPADGQAGSTE